MLEDRLRTHWLVSQRVIIGDARPYIGALVTIDPGAVRPVEGRPRQAVGGDSGRPSRRSRFAAEIQAAIDEANKAVSQSEAIKRFTILGEDFTEAGGQLTPTLKLRRHIILEQHAAQTPPCTTTAPASSTLAGSGEGGGEPADGDGHPAGR